MHIQKSYEYSGHSLILVILHFYKVQTHAMEKTATNIIDIQEYLQMDHTSSMLIKISDVPTWWHVLYRVNNEHMSPRTSWSISSKKVCVSVSLCPWVQGRTSVCISFLCFLCACSLHVCPFIQFTLYIYCICAKINWIGISVI
jgi:hypothetical protein